VKKIIFLPLLLIAFQATAETQYVIDKLDITMRSGQSTSHQILHLLSSGTAVEVIGVDEEAKYTQVRTAQGWEGWVISRYLQDGPIAKQRLVVVNKQLDKLGRENKQLKAQVAATKKKLKDITAKHKGINKENTKLDDELKKIRHLSSNVMSIDQENTELKQQLMQLNRNFQTLEQDNISLKDSTAREWFLIGGSVILLGIIIGLIIPKIQWRSKKRWNKF